MSFDAHTSANLPLVLIQTRHEFRFCQDDNSRSIKPSVVHRSWWMTHPWGGLVRQLAHALAYGQMQLHFGIGLLVSILVSMFGADHLSNGHIYCQVSHSAPPLFCTDGKRIKQITRPKASTSLVHF